MKRMLFLLVALSSAVYGESSDLKKEDVPTVLAFVGLDWCPWSKKFEKEVLSRPEFSALLKEKAELSVINLTDSSDKLDLLTKYDISQLPTCVVLDKDGEFIAKEAYSSQAVEAFAQQLLSDYNTYRSILSNLEGDLNSADLKSLYLSSVDLGNKSIQERILEKGVKLDGGIFFLLEQYKKTSNEAVRKKVRKEISLRDPNNELRAEYHLALIDFRDLAHKEDQKRRPKVKQTIAPLVNYIDKWGPSDPDHQWELELKVAEYLFSHNKTSDAVIFAKRSLKTAPDPMKAEISSVISVLEESN